MAMVGSRTLVLAVALTLMATLTKPSHSLICTSQKLSNNKLYANCTDLPTLGAYLHYNYNDANTSISVAFIAVPAKTGGWVAWAINPTGTGMAGAQAFIAFKENGALTVKTYDIVSYSNLTEGKLSFDTWDISSYSNATSGEYTIYASAKVPAASRDKLNYIWQVGPSVTNGRPDKHDFAPANLKANSSLLLAASSSTTNASTSPAPQPASATTPTPPSTTPGAPAPSAGSRFGLDSGLVGAALLLLGAFMPF